MKRLSLYLVAIACGLFVFLSCTKEGGDTGLLPQHIVDVGNPDIDEEMDTPLEAVVKEQDVAEDFSIAYTLLNEIIFTTFNQAILHPELFGLQGETVASSRSACPETMLLPDQGNGDTLVIDFGAGCTMQNGGGNGPTAAGKILLISYGALNTNFNQFIWFDTVTINGYRIIHNFGVNSSGLRFNNVTPSNMPPYNFLFEGRVTDLTSFIVEAPNGDVTTMVPTYTPTPFTKVTIVDNDPPLDLDWNDFIDAHYEIEMSDVQVSTFRTDGTLDVFVAKKIFGDPVVYDPPCRWFQDGKLLFEGTLNQTIDFGIDLDTMNQPVSGTTCDGVLKIITTGSGACRVVVCP